MRIFRTGDVVPPELHHGTFALGNFDGVHLGHQALIDRARALAQERGGPAGVLTFEPHPSKVLNPALAPRTILNPHEKLDALARAGVEVTAVVTFEPSVAAWSPEEFTRRVLIDWLHARAVVVGEGFRFGFRARGTRAELAAHLAAVEVPTQRIGGLVVSSTKIRELILEGRVDAAAVLLGRPYAVEGPVVKGDQRGRTIGVPTANIHVDRELLPKVGVYASRARLPDGTIKDAVANVGQRPTFQGQGVRTEAHLFDFSGDLYGQTVTLELVKMLREEQRFPDVVALKEQIDRDIVAAKAALGAGAALGAAAARAP
jgi:riboflavin kinase / FMN adenylyltransferase